MIPKNSTDGPDGRTYLDLFERNFESERLIVVRIKCALLDARLLLL